MLKYYFGKSECHPCTYYLSKSLKVSDIKVSKLQVKVNIYICVFIRLLIK